MHPIRVPTRARRPHTLSALSIVSLLVVVLAVPAHAQRRRGGGFEEFSPGAPGQTLVLNGRTNAEVDASRQTATAGGYCVGWIPLRPSHMLVLTDDFSHLEISVTATPDTTLVVHGPGGTRCNDDASGLNPALSGSWLAGTYAVYVGIYDARTTADYALTVRQGTPATPWPTPGTGTLDVSSATPIHASLLVPSRLRHTLYLNGRAGGPVDAAYLGMTPTGNCIGFANAAPSHIVTVDSEMRGMALRVESTGDTTLVVNGPNGWQCNDDGVGTDPLIVGHWPVGQYRVWVGSYLRDVAPDYRLSIYREPTGGGGGGGSSRPVRPAPPTSWSFRGAFEGADVVFTGGSIDDLHASCIAHLASTGGARFVDDVRVWTSNHHNSSSYWDDQELCSLVALNARPDDGHCEVTLAGSVESMPFSVQGDRASIRRAITTYVPRMAADGWIDDLTVNGRSYHNSSSYWAPPVAAAILAYNVDAPGAAVVARGTIEAVPFVFSGDTVDAVRAECSAFFAAGVETTFIDDVVVNGQSRHNSSSYWDAGQICMLVASLAE